jgi:hypothetical protein
MTLRLYSAVLFLILAMPASAQLRTIAEAHEVAAGDIRLPQNPIGMIGFKRCSECESESRPVDADTAWAVNGNPVTLEIFREALAALQNPNEVAVQVLHELDSDRVIRVWFWVR